VRVAERKAQEVAERDRRLVYAAVAMIRRDGFHNLTLGRLAEEVGYSKGTIYNHFTCREDLIIELSTESARRQVRYFQAITDLQWDGVRSLYAVALAYMHHAEAAPVLFETSITARTEAVARAASQERLRRRAQVEEALADLVGAVLARTLAEDAYDNPDVPASVALDAVRAYILGYAAMHLLSQRFLWSGKPSLGDYLHVLASMVHGLGWPKLGRDVLEEIHQIVTQIVDGINGEYPAS
jgi:AcrR family transcriptional regulator